MRNIQFLILLLISLIIFSSGFVIAQNNSDEDLFVVSVNEKLGYIDRTGKIAIQPKWGGAREFSEGLAVVATYEGGYAEGFIDRTGKEVIPLKYVMARNFSEGLAAVGFGQFGLHNSGDHKTGFIDKTGKLVIEPKFRDAESFSNGLALIYLDGKYGFINKKGEIVIPLQYEYARSFSEGLACVKIGNRFGFIDTTGKLLIEAKFTNPSIFKESLAKITIGGEPYLSYGGYFVSGKHKIVYINKSGKTIIEMGKEVERASDFSEGLAAITIKNKGVGYINQFGKFVIQPKFWGYTSDFSEGLAIIEQNNKAGFIDKKGKIVIKPEYIFADNFRKGLAWVTKGTSVDEFGKVKNAIYRYIDKTGKVIWQPTK